MNNEYKRLYPNYDFTIRGLQNTYNEMNKYDFKRDKDGNKYLIEKATGAIIYDQLIIKRFEFLFTWLKATMNNRSRTVANERIITKEDENYAFGENAHEVYATIMENIRQQLINNGNVDPIMVERSVENSRYKYAKSIVRGIISDPKSFSATINWVSSAIPTLEKGTKTK